MISSAVGSARVKTARKAVAWLPGARPIEKLLATAWWNWDHPTLEARFEELLDLDTFLRKSENFTSR